MKNKLLSGRSKIVFSVLGLCLLTVVALNFWEQETVAGPQGETGRLEKLIVADGSVSMNIDLGKMNGSRSRTADLSFSVENNAFFTIMTFNDELRGSLPSSMNLIPQGSADLPAPLNASYDQLAIESMPFGGDYELIVRDGKTGFEYFGIEGHQYDYRSADHSLAIKGGRLVLTKQFASTLGQPAGTPVGEVSIDTAMRVIETSVIDNGAVVSEKLPASKDPLAGTVPGPDVMVGDLNGLAQFGSSDGTYVGLSVGTDSCNFGTVDLNWQALPSNDHPVIPQNMYRMSGGPNNDQTFEQIGQSSVKHAFTALTQNLCALGCNGTGGSRLGSGCSDPYVASLNAGPSLGSRAWINPFTGFFPRGDSATPPNNHSGHSHASGPLHRMLTYISDLNTAQNPGATYYAEAQYITPHEYSWCQTNPTQCNMYNNVSYRKYNVTGTGSPFSFSSNGSTQRGKFAVQAWPGATIVGFEPAPGADGIGAVAYKVTNPSPGVWHYEYAVYNQNLDRAVQSFSIPMGSGVVLSNLGFHAPPNHPGSTFDGTVGNTGFSNAAWTETQASGSMTWATETLAQNPNANAIRWGTMYNFRFDSNQPPMAGNATLGFFKTGSPITVAVMIPTSTVTANVSISGRITTPDGFGVRNAVVTLTDSSGNKRSTRTGTFGHYSFSNVQTGTGYTMSVAAKALTFTPQTFDVTDHITGLNFVAASGN